MLVALGLALIVCRSRPSYPAPVIVSLQHTNAPLRVAPGPGGAFLILPDGSLWHWGQLAGPAPQRGAAPKQVGTNCDWVQAVAADDLCVGLRRDGTIWEWGRDGRGVNDMPRQVDPAHDWIGVSVTPVLAVALRQNGTLWAWGGKSGARTGYGLNLSRTNLVQVGGDHDWTAISCHWMASLGMRRDGTLWVWGEVFFFGNAQLLGQHTYDVPTRVCRETNWVGFTTGFQPLARTQSGEIWEPLSSQPSGDDPATSTCRLVASNAAPDHVAMAYCGKGLLCEVRPDGTLWQKDYPWPYQSATSSDGKWRQVGGRSDWTSIWGVGWTTFGLTSDGTLWTWGVDPSQRPALNFSARVELIQLRLKAYFAGKPTRLQAPRMPAWHNEPWPLMRLVPATPDNSRK
jgi:hypothetical protein